MRGISEPANDFYTFFEECIKGEQIRPAGEGERDPQMVGLINSIMEKIGEFVLVDYGCGKGRFIQTLNNLNHPHIKVLDNMHYIGVDKNRDNLLECDRLARDIKFKQRVKRFALKNPLRFYNDTILVDYVFLINTLHEISPLHLDKILSDLIFKLKHRGSVIIHELKQLLHGEKDFITFDEEDILFLFENKDISEWITCNIFPFRSKRAQIQMYNAHIVRTKGGFAPMEGFSFELEEQFFELLKRKQARLIQKIKSFKNKDSRSYAYLITLYTNVSKGIWILEANRNIWAGREVRCYHCGSRLTVERSELDIELDGYEAVLTCSNCGLREKHSIRRALMVGEDKNYEMLKRYYREEFERTYHCPPSEYQIAPQYEQIAFNTSLEIASRLEAVSHLGKLRLKEDFLGENATSSLEKIAGDASLEDEIRLEATKWLNKDKESIETLPNTA